MCDKRVVYWNQAWWTNCCFSCISKKIFKWDTHSTAFPFDNQQNSSIEQKKLLNRINVFAAFLHQTDFKSTRFYIINNSNQRVTYFLQRLQWSFSNKLKSVRCKPFAFDASSLTLFWKLDLPPSITGTLYVQTPHKFPPL